MRFPTRHASRDGGRSSTEDKYGAGFRGCPLELSFHLAAAPFPLPWRSSQAKSCPGARGGREAASPCREGRRGLGWLALVLFFLSACFAPPARGSDVTELILEGTWGSQPEQVGIKLPSPGVLPDAPFMGPGGFRVDPQGGVWIADSVNRAVKVFRDGKVQAFSIQAGKLGDIDLYEGMFFVITRNPDGLFIGSQTDGTELRRFEIPFRSPGRLQVIDEGRYLIAENDGGVRLVQSGTTRLHPSQAMEPAGNAEKVFGIVYDLDDSSRKIVHSGWTEADSEPTLFSLLKIPGQRIVHSRILGLQDGQPWVMVLLASDPSNYRVILVGLNGKPVKEVMVPVLSGCYLPAYWVPGTWPTLYGMRSTDKGFAVMKMTLE